MIKKPVINDEFIDDVMCSALEGGVNYWCMGIKVVNDDYKGRDCASDVISQGGSIIFFDENDENCGTLTKEKFIKGAERYLSECIRDVEDAGDIDGGGADEIVQYALFNELVYG